MKALKKWTSWLLMAIMLFMAFSFNLSGFEEKSNAFIKKEVKIKNQAEENQERESFPLKPTEWYVSASHGANVLLPTFHIKLLTLVSLQAIPEFSISQIGPVKSINRFRFRDLMLSTISVSTRPFRAP